MNGPRIRLLLLIQGGIDETERLSVIRSQFVHPDRNGQVCEEILSAVRDWPHDEWPRCIPSAVCSAVVETADTHHRDCVEQLGLLLHNGELKLEPQGRGLYVP
jgi:hypothetical protein